MLRIVVDRDMGGARVHGGLLGDRAAAVVVLLEASRVDREEQQAQPAPLRQAARRGRQLEVVAVDLSRPGERFLDQRLAVARAPPGLAERDAAPRGVDLLER